VQLNQYLTEIAESYSAALSLKSPAQILLRGARTHLDYLVPGGYLVIGSGGKGTPTYTPWIGFFDPDETSSPEEGLYVCYLFARDLTTVSATIMQGITRLTKSLGRRLARQRLALDSAALREEIAHQTDGLSTTLDLKDDGFRQLAYQAGCIIAKTYPLLALPAPETLETDAARFLHLHQLAIRAKRQLLLTRPGVISTPSPVLPEDEWGPPGFKPKNDADYVATITGGAFRRTRRHERLVKEYGTWLHEHDFAVSTPHPRDLVARRDDKEHLIEVKVIRGGRVQEEVRAAMAQLYTYRYFLYPGSSDLRMVALFSESIGSAFVSFLDTYGIIAVWKDRTRWIGSPASRAIGLVDA
jgi:hypothetical protein